MPPLEGSANRPAAWLRFLFALSGALLGLAASAAAAPHLPLPVLWGYALSFSCVAASTIAVALCTSPPPGRRAALWLVPGFGVLAIAWASDAMGLPAALAVAAALLALGSVVGTLVGRAIEHPGHLLFVALVSSLADTFSVAHPAGPSAAIAAAPEALALLAISWPMFGTASIEPLLGVGDVVFTALYVAASRAHALPAPHTVLALALAFVATLLTVLATALPVPALPFLGLAMLVAHPVARVPPAKDRARGFAVVAVLALLLLVLFVRRSS